MLRTCLAQGALQNSLSLALKQNFVGSRSLASTSQCTSLFHTSAFLNATSRNAAARALKKSNQVLKETRDQKAQEDKPSVVIGTRPGDDATWQNCDLAKILVNEEALVSSTELDPTPQPVGTVHMPQQLGFGVGDAERMMLFDKLPMLSAEAETLGAEHDSQETKSAKYALGLEKELKKANSFAQLLDLRNANAAGIAYENRRRIIAAFSSPSNPIDPGRSEVQGLLYCQQGTTRCVCLSVEFQLHC
jgi:small subunit ribosomal protein S15